MSLAEELSEARSFALYFSESSALSSTPHLYISALATWPRNLEPCRHWKSYFPRIPCFIDASLGDELKVLKGHTDYVRSVTFSPDGKQIVSGSDDKSMLVWDASTGDELKVLKGQT